jgi:hypothetical protein
MNAFVLPEIGKHEDQELDFKAKLNTKDGKTDYLELAKDMAAMANAYGGTIIIGACEDPKGVLSVYKCMTEDEAVFACNEYKTAQRDRLRPTAIVVPDTVLHDGGFLVTVKVEPSMGQAIGVRFVPKVDVAPETKEPPEIYGFPVRIGDNTTWLQPEQLPMLMIPALRRNIVLLRQALNQHVVIDTIHPNSTRDDGQQGRRVEAIDEVSNVVRCGAGHTIPLDQIASVWKSGQWHILWNRRGY